VLRPLSYLGAARPLMLPLFRLLPYLYLPDLLRPLSYLGAARPLMLPLYRLLYLSVPTGPLYRLYRTNFGRCRDLDA
jgi:hypothetical protein